MATSLGFVGVGGMLSTGSTLPSLSMRAAPARALVPRMAGPVVPDYDVGQWEKRDMPTFDYKNVAFGRLVDGRKVLDFVGSLDTANGRPYFYNVHTRATAYEVKASPSIYEHDPYLPFPSQEPSRNPLAAFTLARHPWTNPR